VEKLPALAYEEGCGLFGVEVRAVLDGVVGGLPVGLLLPLWLVWQEVVPGQRVKRRPSKQIKQVLKTSMGRGTTRKRYDSKEIRLERDTTRKSYDSKEIRLERYDWKEIRDETRFPDIHLATHPHHHLSKLRFRGEKKSRKIGDRKMSSLFINRTASIVIVTKLIKLVHRNEEYRTIAYNLFLKKI
jgi:hypothetical protein